MIVCSDKADTVNPDADHLFCERHGHRTALIYNHPEDVTNDLEMRFKRLESIFHRHTEDSVRARRAP